MPCFSLPSSLRLVLAFDDAFVLFCPSLLAVFSERLFSVLLCHIAGNGYLPVSFQAILIILTVTNSFLM